MKITGHQAARKLIDEDIEAEGGFFFGPDPSQALVIAQMLRANAAATLAVAESIDRLAIAIGGGGDAKSFHEALAQVLKEIKADEAA